MLIIEKVGQNRYPSMKGILSHIDIHGQEVSQRTIERDLAEIRYIYGIKISYDRQHRGYFIDEQESTDLDEFMRFLEIVDTSRLITESFAEGKSALKHISPNIEPASTEES